MRATVDTVITTDTVLKTFIPLERWVEGQSLDATPEKPFGVYRWGESQPGMSRVLTRNLEIWIHDNPGNYDRIDDILRRLRAVLLSTPGTVPDIVGVDWNFDGPDAVDEAHRTIVRYGVFRIVGTGI